MDNKKSALILGSTGLIGSYLTNEILENSEYGSACTLVRSPINLKHPKLKEVVIDFSRLSDHSSEFLVDEVFICLGTTRKQAGSKESFKKVDYDYVVEAALLAKAQGVQKIAVVSAIGADSQSRFFYNSIKGQMEEAVSSIGIPSTYFFRPSLLLGERKDYRLGEKVGEWLGKMVQPILIGKLVKYRSIEGEKVAKAMVAFMKNSKKGVHFVESDLIQKIGSL
ncbi:oxidoreductase [Bacillus tianshenii]|uniref:oxidoreductase n=1 Tax=Sutcliffiella tianshenii TaxID=1463404 RepID=UPI001CD32CAC|nr:oxidoreductase [Bacillus tianshenii]MCA1319233.1 oxidoreductase [Bacillus tianshenii]